MIMGIYVNYFPFEVYLLFGQLDEKQFFFYSFKLVIYYFVPLNIKYIFKMLS